jgi:hypothetical protein
MPTPLKNNDMLCPTLPDTAQWSRRNWLTRTGHGLGALAFSQLMQGSTTSAALPGLPHHAAKAKRVIFLFMSGGITQFETFYHRPALAKMHGQALPARFMKDKAPLGMSKFQASFPLVKSQFEFKQHGQSGAWISSLFPETASVADDLTFIHSMKSDAVNHDPALTFMQTGAPLPSRPTMGSWINYGLGSENENLPGFVVLVTNKGADQPLTSRLWDSGFLPSNHSGVQFRSGNEAVLYLNNPPGVSKASTRRMLDKLRGLHELKLQTQPDPQLESRIAQAEMAFSMQTAVPEITDISAEPKSALDLYGPDASKRGTFASNCLMARRLAEKGVRFIQLYHPGWDMHGGLPEGMKAMSKEIDHGCAGLIRDLKQRDMLKDTLVVFGSEFGRTCYSQGIISKTTGSYGREHHRDAFTFWMAGGGIKPGMSYGETDEFGFDVVKDKVHVNDFHATLLHLLGVDHERLTFRHQGRDYRLTDLAGKVVDKILV